MYGVLLTTWNLAPASKLIFSSRTLGGIRPEYSYIVMKTNRFLIILKGFSKESLFFHPNLVVGHPIKSVPEKGFQIDTLLVALMASERLESFESPLIVKSRSEHFPSKFLQTQTICQEWYLRQCNLHESVEIMKLRSIITDNGSQTAAD